VTINKSKQPFIVYKDEIDKIKKTLESEEIFWIYIEIKKPNGEVIDQTSDGGYFSSQEI